MRETDRASYVPIDTRQLCMNVLAADRCIMEFATFAPVRWRTNKLKDLRDDYVRELTPLFGKEEADAMLWLLVERYFGKTKTDLALSPDYRLSESEILRLHFAVKELKDHRPIQYILKSVEFLNTRLMVNESVLIPRPETEELVQLIIDLEKGRNNLRILDIGTGSGCIAITLAKNLAGAEVYGIDHSGDALKTATKNRFVNEVMVHFTQCDILDPDSYEGPGGFNVIVSNPPYVTHSDKAAMGENVLRHEPGEALFVSDEDPLLYYRAILYFSGEKLLEGGRIYLEINERFGREVTALVSHYGFEEVMIRKDVFGRDRFVTAVKKK